MAGEYSHSILGENMLISFNFANFRSYSQEQSLTMVASNKLSDHSSHLVDISEKNRKVVRCALLYGANSSGKTNLIRAMRFAQEVIKGLRNARTVTPFMFSNGNQRLSTFEFQFLAAGRVVQYGFDILPGKHIDAEWLTISKGESDEVVFERSRDGKSVSSASSVTVAKTDSVFPRVFDWLTTLPLKPDELLLTRALSLPEETRGPILRAIIDWLTKTLTVCEIDYKNNQLFDKVMEKDFCRFATAFLRRVDTGVHSIGMMVARRAAAKEELRVGRAKRYAFDFDIRPVDAEPGMVEERRLLASMMKTSFSSFGEQSEGTKQLLTYLSLLHTKPGEEKVTVIDELDRSLHPKICWELIREFSESDFGMHKQLIASTHEAHLLNQDLLRRDEYWFVEKDKEMQSQLVPLSDFKIRNDIQIEKGYLQGRFGGVPVVGPMDALEAMLCDDSDGVSIVDSASLESPGATETETS